MLPLLGQPGVHREDKFSIPLIVFFREADWPFKPLTFKDSILFNPALGPKCLFLSLPLPRSPGVSHTCIYLLWPQRRARPKTLEVEVCQYLKERQNHLGVNLMAAGNATPLTPLPTSPPPSKKNGSFPRSPSPFLPQSLAIPGVLLHGELSCDKRLVVFNN